MYKITLSKDDFLRYYLYSASISERINRKRTRSWILITIALVFLALFFMDRPEKFLSYYFLAFALATLIFYPRFQKWQYKKHYEKIIDEKYKSRFGIESELYFEDGYMYTRSEAQQGKLKLSEIELISEIQENLFIRVKTGENIIIPKRFDEYEKLREEMTSLLSPYDIEWLERVEWEWK